MCRFFLELPMDKALAEGKKRRVARDLYEKKRIYIWSIRLLCVLSQCQRDNQRDFQSEIPTLTFHFEIVFSSLYKFCEGMFRRETVHSHFFVPPSLFHFSVSVPCCPFEAEISFCRNVPLPKALRMGLSPPHCRRRRGDVSGMWWVSARMGRPGCLGRRRASMVGI